MNKHEFAERLGILEQELARKTLLLEQEYLKANALYSVGDYLYCVTGNIQVEEILLDRWRGLFEISYRGKKLVRRKGVLVPPKKGGLHTVRESDSKKTVYNKNTGK